MITQKELFLPQKKVIKLFIAFLMKEGIYQQYVANLSMFLVEHPILLQRYFNRHEAWRMIIYQDKLKSILPTSIIDRTLHWEFTNEGHDFWNRMSSKWADYYRDNKRKVEKKLSHGY